MSQEKLTTISRYLTKVIIENVKKTYEGAEEVNRHCNVEDTPVMWMQKFWIPDNIHKRIDVLLLAVNTYWDWDLSWFTQTFEEVVNIWKHDLERCHRVVNDHKHYTTSAMFIADYKIIMYTQLLDKIVPDIQKILDN